MDMLALIVHPLIESLAYRTAAICGNAQLYRNFTKWNFYDLNRMRCYWLDAYNREMEEQSPNRLHFVSFPMNPALLNNPGIAYVIYHVEKRDNLRDKGRADLLLLYTHCCEHLNNGFPVKDRFGRKETFIYLHSAFGPVILDVYDFNDWHKLKNNFELDVLESLANI